MPAGTYLSFCFNTCFNGDMFIPQRVKPWFVRPLQRCEKWQQKRQLGGRGKTLSRCSRSTCMQLTKHATYLSLQSGFTCLTQLCSTKTLFLPNSTKSCKHAQHNIVLDIVRFFNFLVLPRYCWFFPTWTWLITVQNIWQGPAKVELRLAFVAREHPRSCSRAGPCWEGMRFKGTLSRRTNNVEAQTKISA